MDNYQKKVRRNRGWGNVFIRGQRSLTCLNHVKLYFSNKIWYIDDLGVKMHRIMKEHNNRIISDQWN